MTAKRKGRGQGDPGEALAYLRVLDGVPAPGDLATLAAMAPAPGAAPLAFTSLTAMLPSESRDLAAGAATRYIGGKATLALSEGAAPLCLVRRRGRGRRQGLWHMRDLAAGVVEIPFTPADYATGAAYEIQVWDRATGGRGLAAIDYPPGSATLGRPGRGLVKAFPLVRTAAAVLLWLRADVDPAAPLDVVANGAGRTWRLPRPVDGNSATLLIDGLASDLAHEFMLTLTLGARREALPLAARTLPAGAGNNNTEEHGDGKHS